MMRGFLNNSQEKAGQIGPPRCSGTGHISFSGNGYSELTGAGSENIPLFKPKLDYGVVSDAGNYIGLHFFIFV